MIHRQTDELSQWELPGGKVEPGESPVQAMRRELREELGVVVTAESFLDKISFFEPGQQYFYSWFKAEIDGVPTPMEVDKHDQVAYFALTAIRKANDKLSSNLKVFLDLVEDGEITLES